MRICLVHEEYPEETNFGGIATYQKTMAEELVKQEMIIYAIAEKEGISVTEEEYDAYLQSMLASSGFADEKAFESYAGMSVREYADLYKLDRDLLLTKELDTIYDRLSKK